MKTEYYEESDMLYIGLSDAPSAESEEVTEGFVFDFGVDGKVVGIEVERASHRVDLRRIRAGGEHLVRDAPQSIYTVGSLSSKLGVSPRAIQKSIRSMSEAGIQVGHQAGDSRSILLTESDIDRIQHWRTEHKPGRPAKGA